MSARVREVLALALVAAVALAALAAFADARTPDEVDRITQQVMVRIGGGDTPPAASGRPVPSPTDCVPETVIDDYGFEVPITAC